MAELRRYWQGSDDEWSDSDSESGDGESFSDGASSAELLERQKELKTIVAPGTRGVDPARYLRLVAVSQRLVSDGAYPGLSGTLALHWTFHGVPTLAPEARTAMRRDGAESGPEIAVPSPELAGTDGAGLVKVAKSLRGPGSDAIVLARSPSGARTLNLMWAGPSQVSIVDVEAGTMIVLPSGEVEAEGAGLGKVYASVFDAEHRWIPIRLLPGKREAGWAADQGGADLYEEAERKRYETVDQLLDRLAAYREVPVEGTMGRLRQWAGALILLGASVTAEFAADLSWNVYRDIIALVVGADAEDPPQWWLFPPSGHPLPVRPEDLPPEAQAVLVELFGVPGP